MATPTPAEFRAVFPEFTDPAKYPDARITFFLTLATKLVSECRWGELYGQGVMLVAAHYLALGARQVTAGIAGTPGTIQGAKTSKKVGEVSVGYAAPTATAGAGYWGQTIYGEQYWQLLMMFGMGAIQLV